MIDHIGICEWIIDEEDEIRGLERIHEEKIMTIIASHIVRRSDEDIIILIH
jgi:hypothetical protein